MESLMPKAFTHLCKKVNLSLYNDTLTVYPKSSVLPKPIQIRSELDLLMVLLFSQMDCNSAQVDQFFMMRSNELGVYRFIHRDDTDHDLYHQDEFSMDDNHYHAQFDKAIDESKLENIL
ncbi:TPA: Dot/Icm T4SS effector LegA7, partial [Legionella pneumophila subsp. pneumophila]|nr:Dot/Icm T4SS effector LegA7 [Legionella pneumophila subsp. pneumophila]HAT9455485.1 Dot/Icm T4SS effector LegA7 [Legionella pneumophila subsp. pneumophila]HAT9458698.1 Dot/Icm T4SS effector LegA7 [Legionella pneumophila subsp. pneumophila]HAT9467996.1 Dot/Icm T4SS effector LegA7 [Legionella pneumophila subsp. pneumophila]